MTRSLRIMFLAALATLAVGWVGLRLENGKLAAAASTTAPAPAQEAAP